MSFFIKIGSRLVNTSYLRSLSVNQTKNFKWQAVYQVKFEMKVKGFSGNFLYHSSDSPDLIIETYDTEYEAVRRYNEVETMILRLQQPYHAPFIHK